MNYRRGSFLRSLEEECEVRRERAQRRPNETEFEIIEPAQKIIILNARRLDSSDVTEIIELDNRYVGNITPPNSNIKVDDEIVRSSGQALTVTRITTILEIQRLDMVDRRDPIA